MSIYMKRFMHRGLIFGGLGPIVVGVVYAILQNTHSGFSLTGMQVCIAIVSTYFLAFLQAGASVFNQIEDWTLPKSLLCHFGTLYAAYTLCYLLNTWIPFEPIVLLIFTGIFIGVYALVWLVVYLCVRAMSKRFNERLNGKTNKRHYQL